MKITINRTALLDGLREAHSIATKKSALEILSGIKITAEDNKLILTASNETVSITKEIIANEHNKLVISANGSVVLEAKFITEGISKLSSDEVEILIEKSNLVLIRGNNAKFNINGSDAKSYPKINFVDEGTSVEVDASQFLLAVSQTSFATGNVSGDRPILEGVNFIFNNNSLTLIGSDTYRIASKIISIESIQEENITVPTEVLSIIRSIFKNNITIRISGRSISFSDESTVIQSRLLDGIFPKVDHVFPKEYLYEFEIDRHFLIAALERTGLLRKESFWDVKLVCKNGNLKLLTRQTENGSTEEILKDEIDIAYDDSVNFNGKNAIEAAKAIKSDIVILKFNGQEKPFSLFDPEDAQVIQLLTPMRKEW